MLTYLLNSGSFSRSNRAEWVVILEGLNSEISSSILRPIRLAEKQEISLHQSCQGWSAAQLLFASCSFPPLITPPWLTAESRSTVGRDIQQSLRQDSVSLEALNEYVPLPLGQFAAIFVHQKRQMSEGGRPPSKSTVHEEMFGCGDEPLGPP